MKRLFSFLSLLFFYIIGYAQAWVWDEIAQDVSEGEQVQIEVNGLLKIGLMNMLKM